MLSFKQYLIEYIDLNFLENDEKYFEIAMNKLADRAYEDGLEEYPTTGETYDPNYHRFENNAEMRNGAYDILGNIRKGIESNIENNKVKVYRGLVTSEMTKRVNESNFNWESWSLDENVAREFSGWCRGEPSREIKSWLLIGLVELDDIDYELMIDRWIDFPEEYEIPVAEPMNVEISEVWNLDDDKVYKKIKVDKEKNVIEYK